MSIIQNMIDEANESFKNEHKAIKELEKILTEEIVRLRYAKRKVAQKEWPLDIQVMQEKEVSRIRVDYLSRKEALKNEKLRKKQHKDFIAFLEEIKDEPVDLDCK